jgi:hypothetical protein
MSTYAEVQGTTLITYPYTFANLQAENPNTNFGNNWDVTYWFPTTTTAINNGYTLQAVTIDDEPFYDKTTQICTQNSTPTLINGVWVLGWTVTDMTTEQQSAYNTQQQANNKSKALRLLSETDWVEIPSVSNTENNPHLVNVDDFLTYRNTLRAIAVNPPIVATWPTKPTEQWSN